MSTNRIKQMKDIHQESLKLFIRKNKDYGDSFATYGPVGVIVRMQDKINRLVSVSNKGITMVNTESLRDTLIDLHNYSAMAIMLMDEKDNTFIPISDTPESNEYIDPVVSEQITEDIEDSIKNSILLHDVINNGIGFGGFGC